MLIKKGQKLKIRHAHKGTFIGIVAKDFDTETTKFWPINACETVQGMTATYEPGEHIPCRGSLVTHWELSI